MLCYAIGLTENETTLDRWFVSGPEVARILSEFEADESDSVSSSPHHEQNHAAQQAFATDVQKLVKTLQSMGNPFEDQRDLVALHSWAIVDSDVADYAGKLYDLGKEQYESFASNRIASSCEKLFAPLTKNKVAFLWNQNQKHCQSYSQK